MDRENLSDLFNKLQKPQYAIAAFIGLGLLIVLGIIIFQRLSPAKVGTITENQIKIQKGEKIVIVDKNGLVEYRSGDKVFYEVWDTNRISEFFTLMEEKARQYLENPNIESCSVGYTVTLYLDGEEVIICLEEEETLDEIYQGFGEEGGGDIGDIFEDFFADGGTPTPTLTGPTPIPTTLIVSGEEGGTPGGGGSQPVVECDLYGLQVNTRTVISNTVCFLEPSPTLPPLP